MPARLASLLVGSALAVASGVAAQSLSPATQPTKPADRSESAASFVRAYAAATGRREVIARWLNPICVRVTGLADDQATAVRARVEEVAKGAGIGVQPSGCQLSDIEIGFATAPQAMLDDVIKSKGSLLGDATSGTQSARTVTLPIQAWYRTNGRQAAANVTGGLKALADYRADGWAGLRTPVLYQDGSCGAYAMSVYAPGQPLPSQPQCIGHEPPRPGSFPLEDTAPRQFLNVFVIVDLRRTSRLSLGRIADYVAMLALSQPKSLGACNILPSITDLFAGDCPGRGLPQGLTPTDVTYLHALYAADHRQRGAPIDSPALLADVAGGMAPLLANAEVAAK